jgi:hypothetical protein
MEYMILKIIFNDFMIKLQQLGVDRPAQVENIAQLQQNITDLRQEQEYGNMIQDTIYSSISGLETNTKALNKNIENADSLIIRYISSNKKSRFKNRFSI